MNSQRMKKVLLVIALTLPLCAQVKIAQQGKEKISVEIDGKPFTDFYVGPETAKPYLHPLRTADGKVVTRGFPMVNDIPGEAHDHPHHRGLWLTHGDVNGYDFWANEDSQPGAGKGKGRVVLERVDKFATGKKSGTVSASFAWKIPSGETLLIESRKMTFYSDPQLRTIDFDITLSPQQEVRFGDTKEGMFAMRVAAALEEDQPKDIAEPKRTGKIVNAQNSPQKSTTHRTSPSPNAPARSSTRRTSPARRTCGASVRSGSTIRAGSTARRWGLRCSITLRTRDTRRTGMCAPRACSRRTFSACTISSATPGATPA